MKVYKVELSIIDFDGLGPEEIKDVIENTRYPNHCMNPDVTKIEVCDICEWDDSHDLNNTEKFKEAFSKLEFNPIVN